MRSGPRRGLPRPRLHRRRWRALRSAQIRLDWIDAARAAAPRARLPRRRRSPAVGDRPHLRGSRLPPASAPMRWRPRSWCRKARWGAAGRPSASAADIARALALLAAIGPYDVGQAAVVADAPRARDRGGGGHRPACSIASPSCAASGRMRGPAGGGVLVKAPKPAPGPALRSAVDRAADDRGRGARRPRRPRGRRRRDDRRRARPGRAARRRAWACSWSALPAARDRRHDGRAARRREAAPLKVFIVAGEESGDRLGGALMQALRRRAGGPVALRRRRRPRDGGAGRREPVSDRRSRDRRLHRDPAAAAGDPARIRATAERRSSRRGRTCW